MKLVICGYFGIRNIGDEAILLGLKKVFLKIRPDSEIKIMGKGRLFPVGIRSFLKSLVQWKLWRIPCDLIKKCDVFIMSGGLFTNEESFFTPFFWALHGLIARFFNKPVLLLGVSITSMSLWNAWVCKKLFKKSALIIVRDSVSYELLKSWGISSRRGPDFATFMPYEKEDFALGPQTGQYVVISARPYKSMDETLYKNIAHICDSLIEKYGLNIRLIPFHKGADSDVAVLNTIFDHMKHKSSARIENFYESTEELMRVLANAKVVLATRLHAGILSALAETPFIALSYMDKVKNLWKEFPYIKVLEISKISVDEIMLLFQDIFNSDREHRKIVQNVKQKFMEQVENIEQILQSSLQNY
jgi:polysaccharide pyruvyl transferase CsaB